MRYFSAQYVFTNCGPPLKRAVVGVDDDGRICSVTDTSGLLSETHSVEFHNGIILPGFVNCHCHLELSHLRGKTEKGSGLARFIEAVRNMRQEDMAGIKNAARNADSEMYNGGIALCADICNTSGTFDIKRSSRISYLNLLEVFGVDSSKSVSRMEELMALRDTAQSEGMDFQLVPHSVYSLSLKLLKELLAVTQANRVTSVHFMESSDEEELLLHHRGGLYDSYRASGLLPAEPAFAPGHAEAALDLITSSGNLILVHNLFADRETIRKLKKRKNVFWCLCPGSNIYIGNMMPPVELLLEENCEIVLGTDSLASNDGLSILTEMKLLQDKFPFLSLSDLIGWATINGARALGFDDSFGTIESGKRPGLLLLEDIDLANMKLLRNSRVRRLA